MRSGGRAEQASTRSKDIRPIVMRNIRRNFSICCSGTAHPLARSLAQSLIRARIRNLYSSILAKISESLKRKYSYEVKKPPRKSTLLTHENENKKGRTSSPTLIVFPPQPGNKTLSPALTAVGTIRPSLFGAPGPTAITVASGSGLDVAELGRNIPDAVF